MSRPITLRASASIAASSSVPQRGQQLAAEEQVGGGVDIVGQRQRLVDRLDAIVLGVARIVDRGFLAVDEDLRRYRACRRRTGS